MMSRPELVIKINEYIKHTNTPGLVTKIVEKVSVLQEKHRHTQREACIIMGRLINGGS